MGRFVKGDVVVLSFPFSDLSGAKRRPALVVSDLDGDDIILCQISSRAKANRYSVKLGERDYTNGKLAVESFVLPNKLFTADERIILYVVCRISDEKIKQVANSIMDIIQA